MKIRTDDATLIRKTTQGDHKAYARLVRRHYKTCFQLAWRQTLSTADAEDICQTVFIRIWQRPDKFKPDMNTAFTTWLYRVTLNACTDFKRKFNRQFQDTKHEINAVAPDNSKNLESQLAVKAALQKLSDSQRQVINLFYFEDLSTKDIAQILKITPKAVESHLRRARKTLKPFLTEFYQAAS